MAVAGIVQEIANVPASHVRSVTEHQDGATNAPSLAMSNLTDGPVQLTATGQADLRYVFEASSDLAHWTKLAVRTNLTGSVNYTPPTSAAAQRLYRVAVPWQLTLRAVDSPRFGRRSVCESYGVSP